MIRAKQLGLLNFKPTDQDIAISLKFSKMDFTGLIDQLMESKVFLEKILELNSIHSVFNQNDFNLQLGFLWFMLCTTNARGQGKKIIELYDSSPLSQFHRTGVFTKAKFLLKTRL